MALTIVGAGMAGLIAANLLRRHNPVVVEAQSTIPNNHHAVLRFGSSIVGDALDIPFRKVTMVKYAIPWRNPVADILAYSEKVLGVVTTERSIARRSVETAERWIAPPDLISQMARRVKITFEDHWQFERGREKVISTIPMPSLMAALGYPPPCEFKFRHGWVVTAQVAGECDAYATILVPNPGIIFYRASITGRHLIVESIDEPVDERLVAEEAAHLMGVRIGNEFVVKRRQQYAKIAPIDDGARREFIFWASSLTNIAYSLGRFATWRPSLLTDDLVKDIRLIDGWIREGGGGARYSMELHEVSKTFHHAGGVPFGGQTL